MKVTVPKVEIASRNGRLLQRGSRLIKRTWDSLTSDAYATGSAQTVEAKMITISKSESAVVAAFMLMPIVGKQVQVNGSWDDRNRAAK